MLRIGGSNPNNLTLSSPFDDYAPAFSPDGQSIAFRSEREGGGIFLMGATGESVRRLTTVGFDPSWTPDGKQIVFAAEPADLPYDRTTISSISVVDVASGAVREIYAGDAMQPRWSPHGRRIVFWGSWMPSPAAATSQRSRREETSRCE